MTNVVPPGGDQGAATAAQFLAEAKKWIGTRYVWGGDSPGGFDCSGLIYYSLRTIGIHDVPRTSEQQWAWVKQISAKDLQAGDLVFMNFPGESSPGHVVIYDGHGTIEQAPSTGQLVQTDKFTPGVSTWGGGTVVGYGRIPGLSGLKGGAGASGDGSGAAAAAVVAGYGAISKALAPLKTIGDAIDWLIKPSNELRIAAGIGGGVLLIFGLVKLAGSGRGTGITGAVGIAAVTAGSAGIFIAFHQLEAKGTPAPDTPGKLLGSLVAGGQAAGTIGS